MEQKLLAGGLAALMLALLPMASAYHIDGQNTNVPADAIPGITPPPVGTLSTSDWVWHTGLAVIICESEGILDDRNPNPVAPGEGGLCYTGRNDATGVNAPGATAVFAAGCEVVGPVGVPALAAPPCPPPVNDFTRLDTCAFTIQERNFPVAGGYGVPGFGPFGPASGTVAAGCVYGAGTPLNPPVSATPQSDHGWFAQLGVISCLVPAFDALYYSERYAWWTYEGGTAPYSTGDAAGAIHAGAAGLPVGRRDAYHGHVAMFLDPPSGAVSQDGSAVTSVVAPPFVAGPYAACGASPAPDAAGAPSGPLFLGS